MDRKKNQEHLKNVVLAAMFGAMVYVLTAFLKIPTHQGYIHIGDGMIYLAAALLPFPYAMAAGAVGAGLSDFLSGYTMWVLPTAVIKAVTVFAFTRKKETIINTRNLIGIVPAIIICVAGYYFASVILYGDFGAALADIPTNCIQGVGSAVLFVFLGFALDRMEFKKRFLAYRPEKKEKTA